jgi:hypothetical protein
LNSQQVERLLNVLAKTHQVPPADAHATSPQPRESAERRGVQHGRKGASSIARAQLRDHIPAFDKVTTLSVSDGGQ